MHMNKLGSWCICAERSLALDGGWSLKSEQY